jgi:cytochrome bd-type quinol oxidase subunit 1
LTKAPVANIDTALVNDFFFARSQMAMSLAFHIVFAALGIGMPLLMAIAEAIFLGVYLYGWNRLSPFWHWLSGLPVPPFQRQGVGG